MFPGFGPLVNVATVLVGASIGPLLGHRLPLRLLQIKPVPVGNLLPALLVAPLLVQLLVVLRSPEGWCQRGSIGLPHE